MIKREILTIVMAISISSLVLMGCGANETKKSERTEKVEKETNDKKSDVNTSDSIDEMDSETSEVKWNNNISDFLNIQYDSAYIDMWGKYNQGYYFTITDVDEENQTLNVSFEGYLDDNSNTFYGSNGLGEGWSEQLSYTISDYGTLTTSTYNVIHFIKGQGFNYDSGFNFEYYITIDKDGQVEAHGTELGMEF